MADLGGEMGAEPSVGGSGHDPRVFRRLLRAFVSSNSYGMVLLLILVTYGLSVSLGGRWSASVVLLVQIATVWFALRTSKARRSLRLTADVVLVAAGVVAIIDVIVHRGGGESMPAIFIVGSVLYVIAPFSIVRHLITRRTVDVETMLGAIAAYLLIGLSLAYVYRFLGALQSTPFFGSEGAGTMSQDVFFSFTTLTTTGYGNLVPAGQPGQSLAVMEMIIGQLFLVTALGKIVSVWRPGTWADRKTAGATGTGPSPAAVRDAPEGGQ
ncbi:MAG: ion channel [Actinomycetota bacterium]